MVYNIGYNIAKLKTKKEIKKMKKIFLRTGALAGLAVSALALASCGSSEVEVKDLDGNSYKIAATEDSEAVSKAIVLAANSSTQETEGKFYAFGAEAKINANVTVESDGIKGTIVANASASAGATMGKATYAAYTPDEDGAYKEADVKAATDLLKKNLGALVTAHGEAQFKNFSVDVNNKAFADYTAEEKEEVKNKFKAVDGKTAKADVKAFLYNDGYAYGELNATLPKEIAQLSTEDTAEEAKMEQYVKAAVPFDEISPIVSTALNTYQTKTFADFITYAKENIPGFEGINLPELPKFDAKFYESNEYKALVDVVKELGVKVSNVSNGNVTFEVEVTEPEVKAAAEKVDPKSAAIIALLFSGDKSLFKASVTVDMAHGRLVSVNVSTEALDKIVTIAAYAVSSVVSGIISGITGSESSTPSLPTLPFQKLEGTLSFELNFKYDGDVNVSATPNSSKTYVEQGAERQ